MMATHTSSGAVLALFSFIRVNFLGYLYITCQVLVENAVSTCSVCMKQVENNEWILMKFGVWNFYGKLFSHFNFCLDWTILINISEKDVRLFAHSPEAWIANYWFKRKNVWKRSCRGEWNKHFISTFFPEFLQISIWLIVILGNTLTCNSYYAFRKTQLAPLLGCGATPRNQFLSWLLCHCQDTRRKYTVRSTWFPLLADRLLVECVKCWFGYERWYLFTKETKASMVYYSQ